MSDLTDLRVRIAAQFLKSFGRTPLSERVEDVVTQATSIGRFIDLDHLRDETGDLLCAVLQLCHECSWDPAELADKTLAKISDRDSMYGTLGRKYRVALLGGAFDPPHNGHLEIAQEVLRVGGVDEVWLMPCYDHLAGKSLTAPEHRVEMCRLAVKGLKNLGVFDFEIRHQFRGETYHLVKSLLAEDSARLKYDYRFVLGQDNADTFPSWANANLLERMISFLVIPRRGSKSPRPSSWYLKNQHRFLHEAKQTVATSSTEVRNRLRTNDASVADLLPATVLQYIRENDLYRAPAATCVSARACRTAVFSSTFDPPSRYHRAVAQRILELGFDEVIVCPAGNRSDRGQREHAKPMHRAALVDLTFHDLPGVMVDLTDLDHDRFSTPIDLEQRYQGDAEVWHVVSAESCEKGCDGESLIHTRWERGAEMWRTSRFLVLHPPGQPPAESDLPPHHELVAIDGHVPTAELRELVYRGKSIDQWVTPEIAAYIRRQQLFVPDVFSGPARLQINDPRLLIVFDKRNPKAVTLAERYQRYESPDPNLILVLGGDGTMLSAIRQHWRRRVPIVGLNAGHLGFLANEQLPQDLAGAEFMLYTLPMLRVDAETPDGGGRVSGLAFSDAWIERDGGQAAWLRLDVDHQTRVPKIVGDGMLVATASGSSAYARALGAIPVPLTTPVFTLAGSNIFRPRFWKPMTIADNTVISIVSLDRSGKRPVRGFLDGQPLGVIQSLTIQRSSIATVELAFTGEFDPSGKLLRSLFPPSEDDNV